MSDGKIYAAISAVMSDVGAVGKNSKNNHDNYKYRGIDDIMNALSPAMVKNHVFVIPQVVESAREERKSRNGGNLIYSVVKVKYTFFADDGSSVDAVVIGEAMDSGDKSTNKAMSAAFKYACFQTFCIPTDELKDSEDDSPEWIPVEDYQESQNGYPSREEMLSVIRRAYPEGSKNLAALLHAFDDIPAIDYATDAQVMQAYNHVTQKK